MNKKFFNKRKNNFLNINFYFLLFFILLFIITINILANPILKMSYLINKKLKNKGRVIISGILHSQKFMILNKLRSMGFILEIQYNSNNWSTLLLKKG